MKYNIILHHCDLLIIFCVIHIGGRYLLMNYDACPKREIPIHVRERNVPTHFLQRRVS